MRVEQISLPLPGLEALRAESSQQNFTFLDRLVSDWQAGSNRFDQTGEILLGVFEKAQLIAVGGLNRDPYSEDAATGRVRHIYVVSIWRRRGVGRVLVNRLLEEAQSTFPVIRLRTDTLEAARFYESCGFAKTEDATTSHVWKRTG
jgi:GNAT superfamily N-acetyltransferase